MFGGFMKWSKLRQDQDETQKYHERIGHIMKIIWPILRSSHDTLTDTSPRQKFAGPGCTKRGIECLVRAILTWELRSTSRPQLTTFLVTFNFFFQDKFHLCWRGTSIILHLTNPLQALEWALDAHVIVVGTQITERGRNHARVPTSK